MTPSRPLKLSCTGHHPIPDQEDPDRCTSCGHHIDPARLANVYRVARLENLEMMSQGFTFDPRAGRWLRASPTSLRAALADLQAAA